MQRPPTNRFFAYALILALVGSLFSVVLPASQPSYASHENITVNVGIDEVTNIYEPDDTVAVEGVIDEEVENEDVTIRFREPGGTSDEIVNFGEPGSNGNFDALFEIPNTPDGGAWSVEVDYDGEQAYTYFMVEYDEEDVNVINVVLDQTDGIYEANDEVVIAGDVDAVVEDEDFVEIIVLDPANNEIVDEDEVELGEGSLGSDEFEFSFDLDSDASHGRYAVLVTYDNEDQEGAILFEIEDEDAGSGDEDEDVPGVTEDTDGDLTAEIPEDLYEQGGTVIITGEIDNYDSADNEDLGISVRDSDDLEIENEDEADVEDNGDFEYEYDIADDADTGDYTITITYDNDEVVLTFEVEESASSGGDDDDVTSGITFGDLTAKLNKASYLAGETMTVSGTVDELKEDDDEEPEKVFVLLYRPSGQVVLEASESVEPSSNGAFSANVVLDSDLDQDEDYWITATYVDDEVRLLFDITGVSATPNDEITVEVDGSEYTIGQTVEVSGEVPDALLAEGEPLVIRFNKPDGNPCRIDQLDIPASGSYTYELVLGGTCGVAGEYEVEVTHNSEQSSAEFELIGSSASEYSLDVDGDSYPIEYELSGGSINNMFVRPAEDKLVVTVDGEQSGQLTLVLPREVIDAVEEGEDVAYIVTIEDDSGNVTVLEVEESENTDDARTLVIDYPAGTGRIEISGTQVVPEFGAIAAIVMAVAIVGIIVATARHNNKFSLFGQ